MHHHLLDQPRILAPALWVMDSLGRPQSEIRSYRAYLLSASDPIESITIIEAGDDASVSLEADFILRKSDHAAIEVWDGGRLVCRTTANHMQPEAKA
jgi:hypothetical protein